MPRETESILSDDDRLLEAARRNLETNHPNPDRIGCPPPKAIRLLAVDPSLADRTLHVHLSMCSPCYRLYCECLAAERTANRWAWVPSLSGWWKPRVLAVAAATVAVIAFLIPRLITPGGETSYPLPPAPSGEVVIADLRPYAPVRGVPIAPSVPEPLQWTAWRFRLRLLLPAGTEVGEYGVKLIATGGQTKWSGNSRAEIIDHATAVTLDADFSDVRPGTYALWIEKDGVRLLRAPVNIRANRED